MAHPISLVLPCYRRPSKGFTVQLIWCTALDLANSNWQGQRGKGSKALQETIDAALTGGPLHHQTAAYGACKSRCSYSQ